MFRYIVSGKWGRVALSLCMCVSAALCTGHGRVDAASTAAERGVPGHPIRAIAQQPPEYTKPIPAYAKWGKMAVAEAKQCHPGAAVIDYLHLGRKSVSRDTSEESFRLWLRQGTKEWGVVVRIRFRTTTDELVSVACEDVAR